MHRLSRFLCVAACFAFVPFSLAAQKKEEEKAAHYPKLDEWLAAARGDDVDAATAAIDSLISALDGEGWERRVAAAERLAVCPDRDRAVPAVIAASRKAAKVACSMLRASWLPKKPKQRPRLGKGDNQNQEEAQLMMTAASTAAGLLRALGKSRDPRANAELIGWLRKAKPTKTPFVVVLGACEALCEHRTLKSVDAVIAALKSAEKLLAKPLEKRQWPKYPRGTLGFLMSSANRPIQSRDKKKLHAALCKAFEQAGIEELPSYREQKKIAGKWRALLKQHKDKFAAEL